MSQISVVIPTYNRAPLVCDAIESAINQRHPDLEVMVVDDGSSDSTRDIVAPYVNAGLVRYLWQPNAGVSAARNKGIAEARGEFIAFLDSDDVWMPDHLTQLHDALEAHPGVDIAFSNFRFIGDDRDAKSQNASFSRSLQQLLARSFSKASDGVWVSTEQLLTGLLEIGFAFRIQGCMAKREFLRAHRLKFNQGVDYTEEAQLAIEAARLTSFLFVEEVGLLVRRHDENIGDVCYAGKIVTSYENRIRRLQHIFRGSLHGEQRKAMKHALWKMQSYIMEERTRGGGVRTTIGEGVRLLAIAPSYESVKSVAKALLRKRHNRPL